MEDTSKLYEINRRIGDAERKKDKSVLDKLLSKDFVFRRASGMINERKQYLEQVSSTDYEELEDQVYRLIFIKPEMAYALVHVHAKGRRSDKAEFSGEYINTRFFRKEGSDWLLYAWHNSDLNNPVPEPSNFTGTVNQQLTGQQDLPNGNKWYKVFFSSSARTRWHLHPEGQRLFITSGKGLVGMRINNEYIVKEYEAKPDQVIDIPPGVLHWHGATTDSFMEHTAYNPFGLSSLTSYWFGPVLEEEYSLVQKTGADKKKEKVK